MNNTSKCDKESMMVDCELELCPRRGAVRVYVAKNATATKWALLIEDGRSVVLNMTLDDAMHLIKTYGP